MALNDYLDSIDSGIDSQSSEEFKDDRRDSLWTDDEDDGIVVGEALNCQRRKLPSGGINDRANFYSRHLKRKFESVIGPTPKWATSKKPRGDDEDDSDDEILQSCGFLRKTKLDAGPLPSKRLEFKVVKDLNNETYSEGPYINSVEFHPTSTVAMVAGYNGIASFFAVDGKSNNKLHSVAFQNFPILCSKFIKNGNEAIFGSRLSYIYNYDLMAAKSMQYKLPPGVTNCKKFVVSPDSQYFAVAGKWGEVHLFAANSKEKIVTLQQDSEVTAIEYDSKGNLLFGHSSSGQVTIWNTNTRRVIHKFTDEGCLHGSALAVSSSNQFLACASAEGVVNLYDMEHVLHNKNPNPRKTLKNLTTAISNVKFNSTSEILTFSSAELKNSIKLFHVGSMSVFKNFPSLDNNNKLGYVNCMAFSPQSGYMALGNRNSVVSLFRLKHYKDY